MTEVEALKRFIPILGRISPPGERVIITRNILERIAGRCTNPMGVNHKHAGALAWPNDTTKAGEFESAMDNAVDAGEFVSFIHRVDRRHFQIEELASWPGCPAIAPDSPLVFWLGEPVPAQTAATSAPVGAVGTSGGVVIDSDSHVLPTAPAWSPKRPKRFQGYGKPLYDLLKAAHVAGLPKPSARDVLDRWKEKRPFEVTEVTDNGLKYYDAQGSTKPADLEAIRKAIGRMTK